MNLRKYFGPSTLIAAAFIGPGTLTVCTIAGVEMGYDLLWVILFSVVCTVVLQEMSARLGLATQEGLGEAIRKEFPSGASKIVVFLLVIGAVLIGNAAYESGNIVGGQLGLKLLIDEDLAHPLLIGLPAAVLLFIGGYKWVEKLLIGLVVLMAACFMVAVALVQPDLGEVLQGFIPRWPGSDRLLLLMGLVGTTVVPYNLFLHASTISKKYAANASLRDLRIENIIAVGMGGLISAMIVITAAASAGAVEEITNAADLAVQLEPVFGTTASKLLGIGLLAAGFSSTLTAPLAAAYAARGLFDWGDDDTDWRFRLVWATILAIGMVVAVSGFQSVSVIQFAQVTNATLLPFVAVYLLYLANSKATMREQTNTATHNALGGVMVLVTIGLAVRTFQLLLL